MKEQLKERIKETVEGFFIIVTLVCLAMFILGMIFEPDMKFGYEAFIYPIIYGVLGSIPHLFMGDDSRMSAKQIIIRRFIKLFLIIAILLAFIFAGEDLRPEMIPMVIGVTISIVVIFIAVNVIIYMFDDRTAKDMTKELLAFQEKMI